MAAYLQAGEIVNLCSKGSPPDEVTEAILGKERVEELRRKAMAPFTIQDSDRTAGSKADAWCRSLMAGVDAGRIDVSR